MAMRSNTSFTRPDHNGPAVSRIPAEILFEIFMEMLRSEVKNAWRSRRLEQCLPLRKNTLAQLARVCAAWKDVIYCSSSLWTFVTITSSTRPGQIHGQVSRTNGLKLHVTVHFNVLFMAPTIGGRNDAFSASLDVLAILRPPLHSLEIFAFQETQCIGILECLNYAIPSLLCLAIDSVVLPMLPDDFTFPIFTPTLTHVRLPAVLYPLVRGSISCLGEGLRTLDISLRGSWQRADQLLEVFRASAANLEEVHLRDIMHLPSSSAWTDAKTSAVTLPALQSLRLQKVPIEVLLKKLSMPMLVELVLHGDEQPLAADVLADLFRISVGLRSVILYGIQLSGHENRALPPISCTSNNSCVVRTGI